MSKKKSLLDLLAEQSLPTKPLKEEDEAGASNAPDATGWFDKQASTFLNSGEQDVEWETIMELNRTFTKQVFMLRTGALYRQSLQGAPSYETVLKWEFALNKLAEAKEDEYDGYHRMLLQAATKDIAPTLPQEPCVKVTKSSKKLTGAIARLDQTNMTQLSLAYKHLLKKHIEPGDLYEALFDLPSWHALLDEASEMADGASIADEMLLYALWAEKDLKQWVYGLVEYVDALVTLVVQVRKIDPNLAPHKYLCYHQKKSEQTLFKGQSELESMIANMQADAGSMLPAKPKGGSSLTGRIVDRRPDTVTCDDLQSHTERQLDRELAHADQEAEQATPAGKHLGGLPPEGLEDEAGVSTAPDELTTPVRKSGSGKLSLTERIKARREGRKV